MGVPQFYPNVNNVTPPLQTSDQMVDQREEGRNQGKNFITQNKL